jgi:hypothetical protein
MDEKYELNNCPPTKHNSFNITLWETMLKTFAMVI